MSNPLLADQLLPEFKHIQPSDFEPAFDQMLAENRDLVQRVVANGADTWETLYVPLDEAGDKLARVWSLIGHYNSVMNSDEMRAIFKSTLAKMTRFNTEVGQNEELYQAYGRLQASAAFQTLDAASRKAINNVVRDFRLSGVGLSGADKATFADLRQRLSELGSRFADNVLDSTQAWSRQVTDVTELCGVPDSSLQYLQSLAQAAGQDGYLITLDLPSYLPVMTYCDNRALREALYQAYVTRASDQGPHDPKFDNSAVINEILALRQQSAALLGFDNFAERSLATKMASSAQEVVTFLEDLAHKSLDAARADMAALEDFGRKEYGMTSVAMWDVPYLSEKLKQQKFQLSQEELKPYFPLPVVQEGLFTIAGKLFGISIEHDPSVETYHPDVPYFRVMDNGEFVAGFYWDLFARKGKRGGAWMADCRVRRRKADGSLQHPVAFIACNFTPPVGAAPSLLTHDEVTTLFHEFGHALHHMLTTVEVSDVSGINGVPWDVVELPSQLMENWCWHETSVALISRHFERGEVLPPVMLDSLVRGKNFQSAMQMMRQLEFALFDMWVHMEDAGQLDVLEVLDRVRQKFSVKLPPEYARFSHAFTHIFAGGYAAGYYSYKWAEVLAADVFSRFLEEGLFDPDAGRALRKEIFEVGGSKEPLEMFTAFRGRSPQVDALLKLSGIGSAIR